MRDAETTKYRYAFGQKKPVVVLFVFLFAYAAPAAAGINPVKNEEGLKNDFMKKQMDSSTAAASHRED